MGLERASGLGLQLPSNNLEDFLKVAMQYRRVGKRGRFVTNISSGIFSRAFCGLVILASLAATNHEVSAQPPIDATAAYGPDYFDQGWGQAERDTFYTTSQGSRIMPLSWIKALKANGQPFLADGLTRYGYLANPRSARNPEGLPVGFVLDRRPTTPYIGMTCAACHTRQIAMGGKDYRIDGGPAITDFQAFLRDIQTSMASVLAGGESSPEFASYAREVLGPSAPQQARDALWAEMKQWFAGYDVLVRQALPSEAWGWARLDAVGMIFNRVSGLDLDDWRNITPADAPVRYPFLWNASRQDKTQWPGFAQNGLDVLAMGRNTGEVMGVFGWFHPTAQVLPAPDLARGVEYLRGSSPDFVGLQKLETTIRSLTSPKWPSGWPLHNELITKGGALFQTHCASCHAEKEGTFPETWATPIKNVGTDPKEWKNLTTGMASSGALAGSRQPPFVGKTLDNPDFKRSVLENAVVGTVLGDAFKNAVPRSKRKNDGVWQAIESDLRHAGNIRPNIELADTAQTMAQLNDRLRYIFHPAGADDGAAYEARVLHGVWAAAPYLHNGSVPTLAELLKPPAQRVKTFAVGANYDPVAVGLAVTQGPQSSIFRVGDCDGVSGNGNCGHEYGTHLSQDDREALLEYLKTL